MSKGLLASLGVFVFSGLVSFPAKVMAVEVDDITGFYTPLKNANSQLNQRINLVLKNAAKASPTCELNQLYESTKKHLSPRGLVSKIFGGGIEEWVIETTSIDRYTPQIETSIYKDTPCSRSFLAIGGKIFKMATVYQSIRINGHLIGVDKLSHFFETGLELYKDYLRPEAIKKFGLEAQLNKVVNRSIELEETNLGWTITGIKSYADIHAHLQGALFWVEYFDLESGWLQCHDGQFELKKSFDIGQHAQPGWSEGIQCNEYAKSEDTYLEKFFNSEVSLSFQKEVDANILALETKTKKRHECPIRPEGCLESRKFLNKNLGFLTQEQLELLMTPQCRQKNE